MPPLTLQQARKKKKWTQEQLEAVSGVDQGHISRIERGEVNDPGNDTVKRLELALGLKRGTLIFGDREAVA